MGLNREEDTLIETQEEPIDNPVEESLDINEYDEAIKEVDEEQLVDNPYEENVLEDEKKEDPNTGQFSTLHFTDVNDEINCNACFGSMAFIDPTDDNYTI